jgi:hypothetical protein
VNSLKWRLPGVLMEQKSPIKEESLGEVIDIVKDLIDRVDDKINRLH